MASLFFYILAHGTIGIYFRLYTYYDEQVESNELVSSNGLFWGVMGMLILGYLCLLFVSYFFSSLSLIEVNRGISE